MVKIYRWQLGSAVFMTFRIRMRERGAEPADRTEQGEK